MSLLDTASLICTPNAYKEGKLYSVIPSDGSGDMSVTRATTATRVNSAGLVELVPYNYKVQSENLTLGVGLDDTNITTITANTTETLDPFGGNKAEKYNGSTGQYADTYNFIPQNSVITSSLYVKAGTATSFTLRLNASFGTFAFATFNLTNGTVTTTGTDGYAYISSAINSVGNGWYRCSLTYNFLSFPTNRILLAENGSIYVFGWQLVEGSVAKDYQKTETRLNIPRLDYSNGTCPSLLVEPQRTNLFNFSEQLDNAYWSKIGSITITPNNSVSPSGIQNADLATKSGGSARIQRAFTGLTAGTRTLSCFVKAGTGTIFFINTYDGIVDKGAEFNVSTGVVSFVSAGVTATIEDYGNGWYRLSHTYTSAGTSYSCQFYLDSVGTFEVWGFQFEDLSSYPTSYIPTTSASVTRNADVISKTGISSLIGQTEGTIFWDVYRENQSSSFGLMVANSLGTNSYMNSIYLFQVPNNLLTCDCFVSNSQQFSLQLAGGLSNGRHKIALAYKQNDAVLYVDGVQIATDTSCNIPSMTSIDISQEFTASSYQNNATALWKTRLTNTQLAQLTTI